MVLQFFTYHATSSTKIQLCMGCYWNISYIFWAIHCWIFTFFLSNATPHRGLFKTCFKIGQEMTKNLQPLPSCFKLCIVARLLLWDVTLFIVCCDAFYCVVRQDLAVNQQNGPIRCDDKPNQDDETKWSNRIMLPITLYSKYLDTTIIYLNACACMIHLLYSWTSCFHQ